MVEADNDAQQEKIPVLLGFKLIVLHLFLILHSFYMYMSHHQISNATTAPSKETGAAAIFTGTASED